MRLRLGLCGLLVFGCTPGPSDAEGGTDGSEDTNETGTGGGSGGGTDSDTGTSTSTDTGTDETGTDSVTDTETDSGTDSETDTGMDTDTGGMNCIDMVDLNSQLGMADMVVDPDYIWDQGWAMSACVSGDEVVGEAYIYMRPPDADASNTYCAQAYDLTGASVNGCADCDMAFSLNLVDGPAINFQDFFYCDMLSNLEVPTWGIDLDGNAGDPLMMRQVDMMTWEPLSGPEASLTVTDVEDEQHVDWLWTEEYNAD